MHEPNYWLAPCGILLGVGASIWLLDDLWSSGIVGWLAGLLFVATSGFLFAALWMRRVEFHDEFRDEFHDGAITIQRSVLGMPVGSARSVPYDRVSRCEHVVHGMGPDFVQIHVDGQPLVSLPSYGRGQGSLFAKVSSLLRSDTSGR
ncbi:MAG: hypothetical protein DWQ31_14940 [Planctomycetota bacterium]|nr:MAG: hypothetical protein DWQ31_14940 [Planctomycetota bacterium]REJ87515.1 MAG: hypothetical protein DWQ35_21235 [Planctomycetota bacterium]